MPITDPLRVYDGFNDLSSGMDGGRTPEAITTTSMALGVNVTTRFGWARTRPSWVRHAFWGKTADLTHLTTGFFQGGLPYYNAATGATLHLIVSSGRIFTVDGISYKVTDITPAAGLNDPAAVHYLTRAEGYVIIQNGKDVPLIFDGTTSPPTLRAATAPTPLLPDITPQVPVGTMMAYGQGRLFVASPDRTQLIAGDLVFGGSTDQATILRSAPGITGSKLTTITTKAPHHFKQGDLISIQNHFAGNPLINATWIISGVTATTFTIPLANTYDGLGGTAVEFTSGAVSDLLNFTETLYLNEKGIFTMPSTMGRITAMSFYAIQDTATGQGDLLVFGEHGVISLAVSAPRTTWLDIPMQKQALVQSGATSPDSVVSVNSDVFFRSHDGLRTYRSARGEFAGSFGQTPISTELKSILDYESLDMLTKVSAGVLDNRFFFTVSPIELPVQGGDPNAPVPLVYRALAVLDFNNASRNTVKSDPAYEGVWTGLNVLKLVSTKFAGTERCFMYTLSAARALELWEITKDTDTGADVYDTTTLVGTGSTVARTTIPISCAIETRAMNFNRNPYDFIFQIPEKKLVRGDIWLGALVGDTTFRVFWKPDLHPYWFFWGTFSRSVQTRSDSAGLPPTALLPGAAPQIMMPTPPKVDDESVFGRPAHRGFTFQVRLEWDGGAQIQKLLLHALQQVEATQAHAPGAAVMQTIPAQGSGVPAPTPSDLLAYSAH